MPRKIRDAVVVITGASSGIGSATALACACRGAAVVVAARREGLLKDVAGECERLGGRALAKGLFGSPLRGVVRRGPVLTAPRLAAAPRLASSHRAEAPPEPRRLRPLSGRGER